MHCGNADLANFGLQNQSTPVDTTALRHVTNLLGTLTLGAVGERSASYTLLDESNSAAG